MNAPKYPFPEFLIGRCTQEVYLRWLQRKATKHQKRDFKRGNTEATVAAYKVAIHHAVLASGGYDDYTEATLWTGNSSAPTTTTHRRQVSEHTSSALVISLVSTMLAMAWVRLTSGFAHGAPMMQKTISPTKNSYLCVAWSLSITRAQQRQVLAVRRPEGTHTTRFFSISTKIAALLLSRVEAPRVTFGLLLPELTIPGIQQDEQIRCAGAGYPLEIFRIKRDETLSLEHRIAHHILVLQAARESKGTGHLPEDGFNAVFPRRPSHALRRSLQACAHRRVFHRAPSVHHPIAGGHHQFFQRERGTEGFEEVARGMKRLPETKYRPEA